VDGERDLLHGGNISSSVVMAAKLKQCSRYCSVEWRRVGLVSLDNGAVLCTLYFVVEKFLHTGISMYTSVPLLSGLLRYRHLYFPGS